MAKIKITIDEKDVEISVDDAKRIYNELKDIFGEEFPGIRKLQHWEYPQHYPQVIQPLYSGTPVPNDNKFTITCGRKP